MNVKGTLQKASLRSSDSIFFAATNSGAYCNRKSDAGKPPVAKPWTKNVEICWEICKNRSLRPYAAPKEDVWARDGRNRLNIDKSYRIIID
jgi:hypothetical protein